MRKILILACVGFIIGWGIAEFFKDPYSTVNKLENQELYPSVNELEITNGVIHHPTYGNYPEEVTFEEGMTLHPGQSAVGEILIEL